MLRYFFVWKLCYFKLSGVIMLLDVPPMPYIVAIEVPSDIFIVFFSLSYVPNTCAYVFFSRLWNER